MADLKEAQKLVHGLGEVEPPPFFEQRIMSRVREEAGRKQGILRRLFYPLYVKVPIQALAMLLIAVLAIYLYRTGDPEMKQPELLFKPLTETGKGQMTAESPSIPAPPSTVTPVTRVPAGDLYQENQPRLVAPPFEKGAKEEKRAADSRAPIREETLAAARPAAPVRAAQEQDTLPAGEGALDKTLDRAGQQDAAKVPGTFSPDRKRQEKMADAGAVAGESGKTRSEPLPPLMTAAATSKRSVIELTLQVSDLAVAIREIEAHLDQVKARVIERQHHRESEFLKAEIAAPDAAALLDLLKALGRVNLETSPPTVTDGKVTVGIKIVSDR